MKRETSFLVLRKNFYYERLTCTPREELIRQVREFRKSIYKIDESMHDKMLKKREAIDFIGRLNRLFRDTRKNNNCCYYYYWRKT